MDKQYQLIFLSIITYYSSLYYLLTTFGVNYGGGW